MYKKAIVMFRQFSNSTADAKVSEPFEVLSKLINANPEFIQTLEKNFDLSSILDDLIKSGDEKPTTLPPMQQLFNGVMDKLVTNTTSQCEAPSAPTPQPPTIEYNIFETDTHLIVCVDVPGVDKADILVSYECQSRPDGQKTLNITSERRAPYGGGTANQRIYYGMRALSLLLKRASQAATTESINAKYENGVLTIYVPKENETARRVVNTKFVNIA